jgi:hypothetical protein
MNIFLASVLALSIFCFVAAAFSWRLIREQRRQLAVLQELPLRLQNVWSTIAELTEVTGSDRKRMWTVIETHQGRIESIEADDGHKLVQLQERVVGVEECLQRWHSVANTAAAVTVAAQEYITAIEDGDGVAAHMAQLQERLREWNRLVMPQ